MRYTYFFSALIIAALGFPAQAQSVDTHRDNPNMVLQEVKEDCWKFNDSVFVEYWYPEQTFAYMTDRTGIYKHRYIEVLPDGRKFSLPIYGKLWSLFKKGHNGLDIHLNTGDSVRSMFDGKVRYAMYNKGGFGNLVIVRHHNGLETYYAHFSKLLVKPGQDVKAGEVVGLGGSTGRSKGPHLHLEIRFRDKPLDPMCFIDYENRTVKKGLIEICRETFEPWNVVDTTLTAHTTTPSLDHVDTVAKDEKKTVTEVKKETVPDPKITAVYHIIKSGDTLYSLAKRFGTTVQKICSLNKITDSTILSIGRKLKVR